MPRSTLQYKPTPKDDDALRLALIRLAKQYGRYGYRKVGELLRAEGRHVNHKKLERLWREEGLQLPHRHKRRKRLYHHDASVIRLRPKYPNHIWSVDFVHDRLSNGRPYKMLTVLDEYTREALSVTAAANMSAEDVLEALYPLLLKRGKPVYLRSVREAGRRPQWSGVRRGTLAGLVEACRHQAHPHLPRLAMGERVQRALQWHAAARSPQRRVVRHDPTGPSRHQSMAPPIQPPPTPPGPQHACTRARDNLENPPKTGPDTGGFTLSINKSAML